MRLLAHGYKVYSMHDEDGIIDEIFKRIGTTDRFFVEFGAGDGLENNTLYLILRGWKGVWIDPSAPMFERMRKKFSFLVESAQIKFGADFITPDNVERIFEGFDIPRQLDLLSIDIDFNDFWVWRAIENYRPRVVVIEYNASLNKEVKCVVQYNPAARGSGNYYNSSLRALEDLGRRKGYALVGCNFTGVNAFFVREDLVGDKFLAPYTAANHFEPPRYFVRMPNGHHPDFGRFETWDGDLPDFSHEHSR